MNKLKFVKCAECQKSISEVTSLNMVCILNYSVHGNIP